jgi:hypothetical protein
MSFLTFDEWHVKKYGAPWEDLQKGLPIHLVFKDLSRKLREYTSEMVAQHLEKPRDS